MTKLKPLPCPICGDIPPSDRGIVFGGMIHLFCAGGVTGHSTHYLGASARTERTAIKRWNRMVGK